MPVYAGAGDRLILANGSLSSLKRPSVPLSIWGGGGGIALSGAAAQISFQGLYEEQPWVRVVVDKLNRQVSRLPLKTYRLVEGSRFDGDRERVRDHPVARLLGAPQPRRSPSWLKQKIAHPALVHGNGLIAKGVDRPGAAPSSLIALDWRFLTPHCNDAGELEFWETRQTGEPRFLAPEQVMHFAWESGCGDLGVSPLKALGATMRNEDAIQRYEAASFANGVRHSSVYVLPADADLSEEDKEELRAKIQSTQGGVDRAFQMALVGGGGSIQPMSHTAVEAELIDQRKLNREEVAAVYDVPPPMVGILDRATFSNVTEQHKMLYTTVLGPWLVMIEETINAQLIGTYEPWAQEGVFVEFDLAEVLKGNLLDEIRALREAIAGGFMTPNQALQVRNQAPSDQDGMDKYYLPANNLQEVGSDPTGGETPPPVKQIVDRHIARVADRLRDKGLIDSERVYRELRADVDEETASKWTHLICMCTTEHEIRALNTEQ